MTTIYHPRWLPFADAIALCQRIVLIKAQYASNTPLRMHELVHVEQMKRDGAILWTLKTWYYYFRYGYQNSPYEVEARQLSGI